MLPGARTQKGNCVREATSKIMPTTFTAAFFQITNSRANPNVYQLTDRQTKQGGHIQQSVTPVLQRKEILTYAALVKPGGHYTALRQTHVHFVVLITRTHTNHNH